MKHLKTMLLVAMALAFSIGWRAPTSGLPFTPLNMTAHEGWLFVSDAYAGVRVYDVTDPTNPTLVHTIPLWDNTGNAARGDVLYANEGLSLRAYRISGETYELVDEIEREPQWVDNVFVEPRSRGFGCQCADDDAVTSPSPQSAGSSYATFAVVDEYLYYLDYGELVTVSIADPEEMKEVSRLAVGWDIETLHPTEDYLFIGGSRGMYIFDRLLPAAPRKLSRLEHTRACDPVVVSGDVAYVTLRGRGRCGGARDVLLTVDIARPSQPKVVCETNVATPHGLAVNDPLLYVSKGDNGFALFDVSRVGAPDLVKVWPDATRDFIWIDDLLYVMTSNQVKIFGVANPESPVLLSTLE